MSMPEAICPNCKQKFGGWFLSGKTNVKCRLCGAKLIITQSPAKTSLNVNDKKE